MNDTKVIWGGLAYQCFNWFNCALIVVNLSLQIQVHVDKCSLDLGHL